MLCSPPPPQALPTPFQRGKVRGAELQGGLPSRRQQRDKRRCTARCPRNTERLDSRRSGSGPGVWSKVPSMLPLVQQGSSDH